MEVYFNIWKSVSKIHNINRQEKKIISDVEKTFVKNNTYQWFLKIRKLGTEGTFLNINKLKETPNSTKLNNESLNIFPLSLGIGIKSGNVCPSQCNKAKNKIKTYWYRFLSVYM